MPKTKLSVDLLGQMEYDKVDAQAKTAGNPIAIWKTPGAMIVFKDSDLCAAAFHLTSSVAKITEPNAIALVWVEESAQEVFIEKLRPLIKAPSEELLNNPNYQRTVDVLRRVKAKTMGVQTSSLDQPQENDNKPVVVLDYSQNFFSGYSGIVALNTFRTAKEALGLIQSEMMVLDHVSIWNKNHACAYELILGIGCPNFFINCINVSMAPLLEESSESSCVIMHDNFHYERIVMRGVKKNIVFPYGTIFAN